jgi:hypothetical protein
VGRAGLGRYVMGLALVAAANLCPPGIAPLAASGAAAMGVHAGSVLRLPWAAFGPFAILRVALSERRGHATHARARHGVGLPHTPQGVPHHARLVFRRPAAPRFRGGPNGLVARSVFMRPGSPGRAMSAPDHHGGFIAWYGPAFWPYAYDDLFEYVLWPSDDADYDVAFWADAYEATIDPALAPDPAEGPAPSSARARPPFSVSRSRAGVRGLAGQSREFAQICGERPRLRAGWPTERMRQTLDAAPGPAVALGVFTTAAARAAKVLSDACAHELPTSPARRLDAMERRLEAMRQALAIIRPAVEEIYDALGDAQRVRFDALAVPPAAPVADDTMTAPLRPPHLRICASPSLSALSNADHGPPQAHRGRLGDAVERAVEQLRAVCPSTVAQTPAQRLASFETRLSAMLAAIRIERPAFAAFSDGGKPRAQSGFERFGADAAALAP